VRRQPDAAADLQPGARRPCRGRHAGAHHGPPAARQPRPLGDRTRWCWTRPIACWTWAFTTTSPMSPRPVPRNARPCCSPPPIPKASPASPAFLRDPLQITLHEQHEAGKIRQRFYEVAPEQKLAAVGTAAAPLPAGQHPGLLQYAPAMPRPAAGVARRGLRRAGAARRDGAARARPGADPVRQPQLLGAGRHRRRRARPRHRPARSGDQRRCHTGQRSACASHRPYRARRPGRLGLQPGQRQPDGARAQHRDDARPGGRMACHERIAGGRQGAQACCRRWRRC
jgi:hypothetical protein